MDDTQGVAAPEVEAAQQEQQSTSSYEMYRGNIGPTHKEQLSNDELEKLSPDEYAKHRNTGEMPEPKPEAQAEPEPGPTPEEEARAIEERIGELARNVESVEKRKNRLRTEMEFEKGAPSERLDADRWAKIRQAQVDGTLDELMAANAAQIGALNSEQARDFLEIQTIGGAQSAAQPPLTPSYFGPDGTPIGPHATEGPVSFPEFVEYHEKAQQVAASKGEAAQELAQRAAGIVITPAVQHAVIATGNPEIAWHLAEHPELVAKLNTMSGARATAELVRIETAMSHRVTPAKAPKPPSPVTKSAATDTGLRDDLPIDEWMRRRNAQVEAKRGRR